MSDLTYIKDGRTKSRTREYRTWINMRTRCENPGTPYYDKYGGRGIRVCERWRQSVDAFMEDMGPRPSPSHSLDRIDVNGDYEPGNCRWATRREQACNKRDNHVVEFRGRLVPLTIAAEEAGLLPNTVLYRLRRGETVATAFRPELRKGVKA